MGRPVKGDLAVVPFPFSDLTSSKRRPTVVVAQAGPRDLLLAQVTSRQVGDPLAVPLGPEDMARGRLRQASNVRPNRLFTADERLVLYVAGSVDPRVSTEVVRRIKLLLDRGS